MARFLFWNVNGRSLDSLIVPIVRDHRIHVVILIEPPSIETLETSLSAVGPFRRVPSRDRFRVYSRFRGNVFVPLTPHLTDDRSDFLQLRYPGMEDVILAITHGPDRRNYSQNYRAMFFARLALNIAGIEEGLAHRRTLVIGDMNASPFESELEGVLGLHAIQLDSLARGTSRVVLGDPHLFFLNPMWTCYSQSPPATYYWNNSGPHEHFWYMLDQVVFRPALRSRFRLPSLRIVSQSGSRSLLTTGGFPDTVNASDHLPVRFELTLQRASS